MTKDKQHTKMEVKVLVYIVFTVATMALFIFGACVGFSFIVAVVGNYTKEAWIPQIIMIYTGIISLGVVTTYIFIYKKGKQNKISIEAVTRWLLVTLGASFVAISLTITMPLINNSDENPYFIWQSIMLVTLVILGIYMIRHYIKKRPEVRGNDFRIHAIKAFFLALAFLFVITLVLSGLVSLL